MNEVNELFTKENVEQIVVPQVVKDDLLSIIEEKLKRAGFYYRIAYRVKAVDSMVNKLIFKDYRRPGTENEDKKMQDLVGIRIILYFVDDVDICRKLLDTLFISPEIWAFIIFHHTTQIWQRRATRTVISITTQIMQIQSLII